MFKNSFWSSRSSSWNKDLLLQVNPYIRHKKMYIWNHLIPYKGVCEFFNLVKFAAFLLALLVGGLDQCNVWVSESNLEKTSQHLLANTFFSHKHWLTDSHKVSQTLEQQHSDELSQTLSCELLHARWVYQKQLFVHVADWLIKAFIWSLHVCKLKYWNLHHATF